MSYLSRNSIQRKYLNYFDRTLLPNPLIYYQKIFTSFKLRGKWAQTLCCFHNDHYPSLSLNLKTGAFKCFACGECGSDIIAFYQRFYHVDFKTAVKALSAWRNSHD